MWDTRTLWFDVAVVMGIFAVGNIVFGHFEEHKPKYLRLLKVLGILAVTLVLSGLGLRWVAYGFIGLLGLAALYVHGIWLPRHGVNGFSGEPKEKYYELIGAKAKRKESRPTDHAQG
ncbi:MAG TPA: hypothetical protein VN577_10705 [Terriglobales bacterium]|nr:hypothetical protein [Terriglobales bacterium]